MRQFVRATLLALGLTLTVPAIAMLAAPAMAQANLIDINSATEGSTRRPAWHRRLRAPTRSSRAAPIRARTTS